MPLSKFTQENASYRAPSNPLTGLYTRIVCIILSVGCIYNSLTVHTLLQHSFTSSPQHVSCENIRVALFAHSC